MTISNDALAAAHVLAELVIAGPASDGRDVAIAQAILDRKPAVAGTIPIKGF